MMRFLALTRRAFVRDVSALGVSTLLTGMPRDAIAQDSSREEEAHTAGKESYGTNELHRLEPVPIDKVVVEDEFWSPKRKVWQEVTIRDCFAKFESDRGGAINNFDKVRNGQTGGHAGDPWMDGLIYEMIRGSADFLLSHPDPELEKQLDGYISRITAAAAIDPHGYVNTYTQLMEPGHEWGLNGGLQLWQHEIYNLGALVDAGSALLSCNREKLRCSPPASGSPTTCRSTWDLRRRRISFPVILCQKRHWFGFMSSSWNSLS